MNPNERPMVAPITPTNQRSYLDRNTARQEGKSWATNKSKLSVQVKAKEEGIKARKGLTMRMIAKATKAVGIPLQNLNTCRVSKLGRVEVKTPYGVLSGYRCIVVDKASDRQPPRGHTVEVLGDKPLSGSGTNIVVSCDCEMFLYHCEYALTKHKASWIRYCNGKPPRVTNPGLVPMCCKHIFRTFVVLNNRGL